jgi:hypothetical protein
MQGGGDERLPRAGRRVQDDVLALEELEDGLFLCRVEREALAGDVVQEAPEQLVARRLAGGQEVVESQTSASSRAAPALSSISRRI